MAHITDEQIKKYYMHDMEQYEEINMLTHIAKCEYCAGRFATGIPETEMIKLPRGLRLGFWRKQRKYRQGMTGEKNITGIAQESHLGCAWHSAF